VFGVLPAGHITNCFIQTVCAFLRSVTRPNVWDTITVATTKLRTGCCHPWCCYCCGYGCSGCCCCCCCLCSLVDTTEQLHSKKQFGDA